MHHLMTLFSALMFACAVGCGGEGPSGLDTPGAAGIDSRVGGLWTGGYDYGGGVTRTGDLLVLVAGGSGSVSGFCVGSDAAVSISGGGTSILWSSTLSCPYAPLPDCESAAVNLAWGRVSLFDDGSFQAVGAGQRSGCGDTRPVTIVFNGAKMIH